MIPVESRSGGSIIRKGTVTVSCYYTKSIVQFGVLELWVTNKHLEFGWAWRVMKAGEYMSLSRKRGGGIKRRPRMDTVPIMPLTGPLPLHWDPSDFRFLHQKWTSCTSHHSAYTRMFVAIPLWTLNTFLLAIFRIFLSFIMLFIPSSSSSSL